ncbi:hypothetical protein Tco_0329208 [Tanacetum coccineum]
MIILECMVSRLGFLKSIKGELGSKGVEEFSNGAGRRVISCYRFGINKWYQSFTLRNFDLEDMELESTNSGPYYKSSIIKLVPDAKSMFAALKHDLKVVWMNKPEVETMSIDALYNNFKIVEQKIKKSLVSTASPNLNVASLQVSTASVSDNTVYAFMVENPNVSNIFLHQGLRAIHEDDLKCNGYDSCIKYLFKRLRLCLEKIMISKECISDMAEEQVQTNMALMAFSDSEVYTDKTCSKTCLKNYETLKKQCDDLIVKLNQTEFTAATYKRGLATVEEQLITYRKNEVLFSEEVTVLKREVACKDYEINVLKSEFEKVKQEKEGIEFKIEKFDKASKDLDKLLGSQITDKSKKGLGYSVVPPPHPLIYNRPNKLDLSYSGLDEFKEPEFKGYGTENSKKESNVVCDKKSDDSKENSDNSLVKEQVSKDTSSFVESSLNVDKETVFPVDKKVESVKPKNHEKPVKKSVRYAEMYRSQTPRGNQRNWNGQKSNQLGSDFVMYNKACFICGSFNHVQAQCKYHQRERMILLKIPRKDNMYSFDMKNIVPKESLTCLIAKATLDESMLWHRRLDLLTKGFDAGRF